ncbi:MAG TPA: hypothetical protein PLU30_11325 [Verrucomicrobiae bacterium]|nr:hypothetical protein [Verrucomicrobiae bacterium]
MKPLQTVSVGQFGDPKQAKRMQWVSECAPGKASLFRRVFLGRASPREAIKAQCLDCVGMDEAAIRECPSTACPLWGFRPYTRPEAGSAKVGGP